MSSIFGKKLSFSKSSKSSKSSYDNFDDLDKIVVGNDFEQDENKENNPNTNNIFHRLSPPSNNAQGKKVDRLTIKVKSANPILGEHVDNKEEKNVPITIESSRIVNNSVKDHNEYDNYVQDKMGSNIDESKQNIRDDTVLKVTEDMPESTKISDNVNIEDEEFVDMVFSKVRHNRIDFVMEKIEKEGFDVNRRDRFANTIMHICAQNNHRKLASMILKVAPTIDVNATNAKQLTPLDYSIKYGFQKMEEWLIDNGAI